MTEKRGLGLGDETFEDGQPDRRARNSAPRAVPESDAPLMSVFEEDVKPSEPAESTGDAHTTYFDPSLADQKTAQFVPPDEEVTKHRERSEVEAFLDEFYADAPERKPK